MAIGLYSISVRGLDVPDLLGWAAFHAIPFVHLRGGPRGVGLAAQSAATVRHWRQTSARTVPITGVTADLDLADVLTGTAAARSRAAEELSRLVEAAEFLGAGWVRLLARTPLPAPVLAAAANMPEPADSRLPLLVEIHHPGWLTPAALAPLVDLLASHPGTALLADTAQLAAQVDPVALGQILDHSRVLHLSDPGTGLHAPGHATVAELAIERIAAGRHLEVAVEWTGSDRTPAACLERYHAACAWWAKFATAGRRDE